MHALHRVLVNLEKIKITKEYLKNNREEAINTIRDFADLETQDFYKTVFDWRETDNAGSWSDEFSENIILGSEKLDDSITSIVELASNELYKEFHSLYFLCNLSALLYGKYTFDSYFYDLDIGSSKITSNTIEKIKQSPEQWALVLFDYHS